MSDHEDTFSNTGYSTPVPELDDHTHQVASVQKPRSRRGTVDTTHSVNPRVPSNSDLALVNQGLLHAIPREFEHAVIDEEHEPSNGRRGSYVKSRRGTVTTLDPRSASPPNSVKAFADARRREREMSSNDPTSPKCFVDPRRHEDCDLGRTTSTASRPSIHSRRYTNENDAKSIAESIKSEAEEDVCFPLHNTGNKNTLQINYEDLEDFIAEEENREKTPPKGQPQARVFNDLRPQRAGQVNIPTIITSDGDFVDAKSQESSIDEKVGNQDAEESITECASNHQLAADINRFEFFSSEAESTIHAAEFGDLILPGEDVRSLFSLPEGGEEDGVWWLNMNNPTEEEIRAICKAFGVHPLTIEDIGTQEAREKIELFPSYYFACFRSFHVEQIEGGQEYEPFNIYVVVFREGTLSFSFSPNPHAAHVRKRITALKDYVALSSDWICYALM
jgi:magnesium transporter